jgi:shikimate kinase
MIIIVFGLAAAGKTYVGKLISKYFNFYHEDADQWLTADMQEYVHEKKIFTLGMLDDFTSNIIMNIEKLAAVHKNLVISQALYRAKNREVILSHFQDRDVLFLQIDADDEVIYQRLVKRGDWVMPDYATAMRHFFQSMDAAIKINNNHNGEEPILAQLQKIPEIEKLFKK